MGQIDLCVLLTGLLFDPEERKIGMMTERILLQQEFINGQ
jgi:hypothetical protein